MSRVDLSHIPPFFLESLDDEGVASVEEIMVRLEKTESSPDPPTELKERILLPVASTAFRYAPFFRRLSEMLNISESDVEVVLGDRKWKQSPLRGIKYRDIPSARVSSGQAAAIVWIGSGVKYPRHRHRHHEQTLVIEGGYTDSDGRHFEAGDLHESAIGVVHDFVADTSGPCIAVSVADKRLELDSFVLRCLARLIGR